MLRALYVVFLGLGDLGKLHIEVRVTRYRWIDRDRCDHCHETDCMVPGVLNKVEVIIFDPTCFCSVRAGRRR